MKNSNKPKELQPGKPRQDHIDAENYVESRRTWNPDPVLMERKLQRINRDMERRGKKRRKSA